MEKKRKRENLEYHQKYNLDKIRHIQIKYRAWKACPPKLDVKNFKQKFHAALLGWKIRRIMAYLKTIPSVKESIDYVALRNDIKEEAPTDMFSKQIIEKYPEMLKNFQVKFEDLLENAVWIKKPNVPTPTKSKAKANIKKERSKPNIIPVKHKINKEEVTK